MATSPKHGDVLIRVFVGSSFQLVDAMTREQIAIVPALDVAVKLASEYGAVWRENVDNRGRPLGEPVLLLQKATSTLGLSRV